MKFKIFISALTLSAIIGMLSSQTSCTYNKIEPVNNTTSLCDTFTANYNSQIAPIIQTNCNSVSCHNSGSPYGDFTDTNDLSYLIGTGSFKARVFDGNPSYMPAAGFADPKDKEKLKCWFDKGHALK